MVSFNCPPFPAHLTRQGDAEILRDGEILKLTGTDTLRVRHIGRALYKESVRIWDSANGNVASFVTSFSFIVEDIPDATPGDGIIFFLAPPDASNNAPNIPPNSGRELLGVANANDAFNQFVGVEFDNYVSRRSNPDHAHVGIDVNSLISLKTVPWNRVSGSLVKVCIIYESQTKTLSVAVSDENGRLISTVGQAVDLKAVLLQETIWVGLSATGRQNYTIKSWSFTSTLGGGDN